jgi:hypothetical protein
LGRIGTFELSGGGWNSVAGSWKAGSPGARSASSAGGPASPTGAPPAGATHVNCGFPNAPFHTPPEDTQQLAVSPPAARHSSYVPISHSPVLGLALAMAGDPSATAAANIAAGSSRRQRTGMAGESIVVMCRPCVDGVALTPGPTPDESPKRCWMVATSLLLSARSRLGSRISSRAAYARSRRSNLPGRATTWCR